MVPNGLADQLLRQMLALQQLGMHADCQHLLVVAAIEDADGAACGKGAVDPPQEVVRQFLGPGDLERCHLHALRIHAAHHVLDRAVLAAGVHRLKHAQQRPFVLGIETIVQLGRGGARLQRPWRPPARLREQVSGRVRGVELA